MARKEDLHLGDHVSALRMSNKAISLNGKIIKIHDDSDCVDILADDTEDFRETVHADDVTVLEAAKAKSDGSKSKAAAGGKGKDKD